MLYECATGGRLPRSRSPSATWVQAVSRLQSQYPAHFITLLQRMLDPAPERRPSAAEILAYAEADPLGR